MHRPYAKLAVNLALSTLIMYLVMFAMIDSASDFYNNLNMFYMALMMVAPMAVLMLLMMGDMYDNRRLNFALYLGFVAVFVAATLMVRDQTAIGNTQFLRSMIPHHSGAILMCREAPVTDPEIRELCARIIRSQRSEIDEMKAILARD